MKTKVLMNTSLVLIAAQALAAQAAMAAEQKRVIDADAVKANGAKLEATKEQMGVILKKNVVKAELHKTHVDVSNRFGKAGKSMHSKHFDDLVGKIKQASTTAVNDSTNLNGSGGYVQGSGDGANGSDTAGDLTTSVCHGVCHGVCIQSPFLLAA